MSSAAARRDEGACCMATLLGRLLQPCFVEVISTKPQHRLSQLPPVAYYYYCCVYAWSMAYFAATDSQADAHKI